MDSHATFVHPDDLVSFVSFLDPCLWRGTNPYRFDRSIRIVRPDGQERWVRTDIQPHFDDQGNLIQSFGIMQDITDQKRASDDLRESEGRYRALLELSGDAIIVSDQGTIVLANPAMLHLVGAEIPEQVLGLPSSAFIHPACREAAQPEAGHDLPQGGRAFRIRQQWRRLDGSAIDVEVMAGPLPWHGRTAIQTIIRDVTDLRRTELELQRKSAELQAVMEGVPALVMIAQDPDASTIVGSHAARTLLRATPDTNLSLSGLNEQGRQLYRVFRNGVEVPPQDLPLQVAARGVEVRDARLEVLLDDGKSLHFIGHATPLRAPDGSILGSVGNFIDITAQLANEQALRAAKAEAERANAAKSRFLAAASHDLRQPLQSAVLFASVLSARNLDPALTDLISNTQAALDSLSKMLDLLLDISRLDAGIVQPARQDSPIRDLLDRLGREFAPQARTRGLWFRYVASSLAVNSDPRLLERILRNLLDNTQRYTEHGGILLGCRRAGDHLRIQVWDTGIGIPEDMQFAIFEEYRQVGNQERTRTKGLGLGLSIVDRLGQLLGHRIALRSAPGRGSMFEVWVPLGSGPTALLAAPADVVASRGRLIAVIDDDDTVLEALRLCLELEGYDVVAAETADTLRDRLRGRRRAPDLILADYRLKGGVSGRDVIRMLRADYSKAIPGILLTGDTSTERLAGARQNNLQLLHKPIAQCDLTAMIERTLAG